MYKVKSGDYLGKIAGKYRVSVAQIKRWNNLKSNDIRIGQKLIIYRGGNAPASASSSKTGSSTGTTSSSSKSAPSAGTSSTSGKSGSSSSTSASSSGSSSVNPNAEYTIYTVKDGESLYLIAKKFPGVSAQNIMDFNKIGSNIKPGMKLRIPKL